MATAKQVLKIVHNTLCFHSKRSIHHQIKTTSCSFSVDSSSYCDGYDDALYHKMKNDPNRTEFYRRAIAKHCQNKIVLDIGCGSLALLSIMAAKNNASKVYAIETNKSAYHNAKELVQKEELSEIIQIMHGHSNEIELPEKCDLIIHEIIGEIASSEGVYAAIKCIKSKYLKSAESDYKIWSIPDYVQTYLTPVEFPDSDYWQSLDDKIIANEACNTINLWNYPQRHYLCSSETFGPWEHIQFNRHENGKCDKLEMNDYEFIVQKDGILGGLLSAIEIGVEYEDGLILSNKPMSNNCMWANKLMMLNEKISVKKGDEIYVSAKTNAECHLLNYHFEVRVKIFS